MSARIAICRKTSIHFVISSAGFHHGLIISANIFDYPFGKMFNVYHPRPPVHRHATRTTRCPNAISSFGPNSNLLLSKMTTPLPLSCFRILTFLFSAIFLKISLIFFSFIYNGNSSHRIFEF